jgi:small subunit ribosomal protein S1
MKQIEPNPWVLLKEKYPAGTKIKGKIRNITDFGIFIGVEEGIDGLVHISDLSWAGKVKNIHEAFKKGDEIETIVLNIDPSNERFSLGIKQLTSDPWSIIPTKYAPGTEITGEVMKVTDFGLFVKIEEDLEGLVHVSEIAEEKVEDPSKLFKVGDKLQVLVVNVDPHEKKIGLSIKELSKASERQAYKAFKDGEAKKAKTTLGDILPDDLKGSTGQEKNPAE